MRGAFIAVVMLIISGQQTMAQQNVNSGAALLAECKRFANDENANVNALEALQRGVCIGIISASWYHTADRSFCPPQSISTTQNTRVVVRYMEQRPQDQHLLLAELAERAFKEAWPCPTQPQRR